MIEAAVFVFLQAEVTVRPLVLLEVVDPLVERPCDLSLRLSNKVESIKGRYLLVGQLLPLNLAGIFTCVPHLDTELG